MNDTDQKQVQNTETARLFEDSYSTVDPRKKFLGEPQARHTDPATSHLAAATVKPGGKALIEAIRSAARKGAPATAFVIAMRVEHVHPNRWSEASIRTAISRAGLRAVDTDGRSPRNQRCIRYSL